MSRAESAWGRTLAAKATLARKLILEMVYRAKAGHIGPSYSCIDIITTLHFDTMPRLRANGVDARFILSKGHASEALYATLYSLGYLSLGDIEGYCRDGGRLAGHPSHGLQGVTHGCGSLGHGLPVALGMALGEKATGHRCRSYVLVGDGELNEGSNWEAAMSAGHYGVDNLCLIVDLNQLQLTGPTAEICTLGSLADKYRAFGWIVDLVDGHDFDQLITHLLGQPPGRQPRAVLARTIKGSGVSLFENQAYWHHGIPDEEQYGQAMSELDSLLRYD